MIEMMHNDGVVMMHNLHVIDNLRWNVNQNYSYYQSKTPFVKYPNLFFTRKGHPYISSLKRFTLRVIESGIRLKSKREFKIRRMQRYKKNAFTPLSEEQLNFCWILLLICWIISFAIFVTELIFHRLSILHDFTVPYCCNFGY